MKLFVKIFLIFCFLAASFFICADFTTQKTTVKETVIQAFDKNDDYLKKESKGPVVAQRVLGANISINNQKQGNNTNSNIFTNSIQKQYKKLVSYIYSKSFLDNKQKISFNGILLNIKPNAP